MQLLDDGGTRETKHLVAALQGIAPKVVRAELE
jgi:hypothetical protein